jgi:hypothetical protein
MKPHKSIADHSDRGLDLEELWKDLGEDPPGKAKSLDGSAKTNTRGPREKAASPGGSS